MHFFNSGSGRSLELERYSFTAQALWVSGFGALTAIAAQIEIPHQPVPYTLQTLVVLLSGAVLGARSGALSQLAYLLAGVAGLPVFAGFGFGPAVIIGPTGGYLLSFPVAAYVVGYLAGPKGTLWRTCVAMTAGMFIIFSLGTVQLNYVVYHDWQAAWTHGFLIFSWWDLLKLAAAVGISHQLTRGR